MTRVLLVQPSMQPPGGGNGVAAWALQALVRVHRVTVLTWRPVEVDPINRFFGTSLAASDFDMLVVPAAWRALPDAIPLPLALLKASTLMRYTRRAGDGYDVVLGIHNEIDHGRLGIQYIHYPTYLRPRPSVDLRWYHQWPALLGAYYRATDAMAGFSLDRMRRNVTLTNSAWTAEKVRAFHGIDARVVYPPVADPLPGLPWTDRASRFIAVGRVSHEKELDRVMRILARARAHRPEIALAVVGTWDRHTARYAASLRRLAAELGGWITFHPDLARDEVRALMARTRYGIHGMREEHFGMAPAEMVRAGMIVWVPDGGGQVEIVGDEPALRYATEEDAAASIARVLASPAEQARLLGHLAGQAPRFTIDRFCREIVAVVDEVAQVNARKPGSASSS